MALKKKVTAVAKDEKPSEVTLAWRNSVDLSRGMGASAYGISLVLVNGVYYGTMSADRAAVELTRAMGPTFTKE